MLTTLTKEDHDRLRWIKSLEAQAQEAAKEATQMKQSKASLDDDQETPGNDEEHEERKDDNVNQRELVS